MGYPMPPTCDDVAVGASLLLRIAIVDIDIVVPDVLVQFNDINWERQ
jgi:hypothetical protein